MIQQRTLELLKAPEKIEKKDLQILEQDLQKHPYMQSIRLIHLYGNFLFNRMKYQQMLPICAAHTTDKKIIYQFLQKNQSQENSSTPKEEIQNPEKKEISNDEIPEKKVLEKPENIEIQEEKKLSSPFGELKKNSFPMQEKNEMPKAETPKIEEKKSLFPMEKNNPVVKKNSSVESIKEKFEFGNIDSTLIKKSFPQVNPSPFGKIQFKNIDPKEIKNQIQEKNSPQITTKNQNKIEENLPKIEKKSLENPSAEKEIAPEEKKPIQKNQTPAENKSNVGNFIDTWHNWLYQQPTKQEIKNIVIDNFIEKSPKITKKNDDQTSDFIYQERKSDISHLMTDTLANLYLQQKLFAKAIEAYSILMKKFPEKENYYQTIIQKLQAQLDQE